MRLGIAAGAATYDDAVELPKIAKSLCAGAIIATGGIPTHHVSPNVDAERRYVRRTLSLAGRLQTSGQVPGAGHRYCGTVAHGDPFCTDGKRVRLVLTP